MGEKEPAVVAVEENEDDALWRGVGDPSNELLESPEGAAGAEEEPIKEGVLAKEEDVPAEAVGTEEDEDA